LVLGAIAAVAYADHIVVSISLVYLYILPLAASAIFLRREISYRQGAAVPSRRVGRDVFALKIHAKS
jgi:hypothetical protein